VPEPGATALTVAVNDTDWPKTDGLVEETTVAVVEARFTVCESAVEVLLFEKFVSPAYSAVMECAGGLTASEDVLKVAAPEPFSVPVPSVVAPSLNVTVPLGVPAPGATALTVAVNVTDWPETDGFAEEVGVAVVVEAWFTAWETPEELLLLKLASPA
jgi:hypothetical protein